MAIIRNIDIDLDEFDLDDLVEYVGECCYVFKAHSIIENFKFEHFKKVMNDYTLTELQDLLPEK